MRKAIETQDSMVRSLQDTINAIRSHKIEVVDIRSEMARKKETPP